MSVPIQPSYRGIVLSSKDALLLFTAAIRGHIPMINRRPHDKERANSIASGNVFIYCEHNSSIKRWTDGVTWSPSRIMGNFLIYRELNKGFPPGEKKRAAKKKRPEDGGTDTGLNVISDFASPPLAMSKDQERALIGSLLDSYDFKAEGLVKKTISVKVQEQTYHLVSYYTVREAVAGQLRQPIHDPDLAALRILGELVTSQNYRVPVDENGNDMATGNSPPRTPPQNPRGSISLSQHELASSPEEEDPLDPQGPQGYFPGPALPVHPHYASRHRDIPYEARASESYNFITTPAQSREANALGIYEGQMSHPRTTVPFSPVTYEYAPAHQVPTSGVMETPPHHHRTHSFHAGFGSATEPAGFSNAPPLNHALLNSRMNPQQPIVMAGRQQQPNQMGDEHGALQPFATVADDPDGYGPQGWTS